MYITQQACIDKIYILITFKEKNILKTCIYVYLTKFFLKNNYMKCNGDKYKDLY